MADIISVPIRSENSDDDRCLENRHIVCLFRKWLDVIKSERLGHAKFQGLILWR